MKTALHSMCVCFVLAVGVAAGESESSATGRSQLADEQPALSLTVTQTGASPAVSALRTDLFISGVYPHLTTYGVYSQGGAHLKEGHSECGIGAIVPWGGRLWMVNYAPHMPRGSEHKLFSVDADLSQPMTIHPESVGGTPAGRMIHKESKQLLIAHYLIDEAGTVRAISPKEMPIRVTAIARHLTDPANLVYYIDMEGSLWEANVHTLAVKRLFKKPVPGWHGKGGYTSQGRLVISNNGELHVGDYSDLLVGGAAKDPEERGVLAEYDGQQWKVVERRQFTEVTGPKGITGGSDGDEPIWTMGWDRRSVRLKVLDQGKWHTYLLPKAAYCNDASHGWYTEWPRIREITEGRWMMDMHGMFFDFPVTFSSTNSAGIRPIGSHLRYIPDFCNWNGRLVLASDETSIQGNELAGQPQSNLWFGRYEDLKSWGPASGYGGPWIDDTVRANTPSDPFLVAGFDRRLVYLSVGRKGADPDQAMRTSDRLPIKSIPEKLQQLPRVTIKRGDWRQPAAGYEFHVDQPVTVYLSVDQRGKPEFPDSWQRTDLTLDWGDKRFDAIYSRDFPAGTIAIPGNSFEHTPGSFGMPHLAFVASKEPVTVTGAGDVTVATPVAVAPKTPDQLRPVTFTIQVDQVGDGTWVDLETVSIPEDGSVVHILPDRLDAHWLRLKVDRDCIATAFLHQTTDRSVDGNTPENQSLFAGLSDVGETDVYTALLYPAKQSRNLRVIAPGGRHLDFTKNDFRFQVESADAQLDELLKVEPEFTVDAASVIVKYRGESLRLPKGNVAYDQPFSWGWPRALREVESERQLANIHGTFYELPLVTNGAPPAWNLMRPVSSHSKQIADFCSWNGLLVLSGVRMKSPGGEHIFADEQQKTALWFGGVDDLWKLGKPVGHGGPWLESRVQANVPSDPYLMTGFDQKTVTLSHQSDRAINFTLQVDITGNGHWIEYQTVAVSPSEVITHEFPREFSAFWLRAVCDHETVATVQLNYR